MIYQDSVLVQLIRLVDQIPTPQPPPRRPRGRPIFYSEKLFMKAVVIMIVRRLHKVGELLAVLEEESAQMQQVRQLLFEGGRFPSRRTFQRRLKALPDSLPDQIGCLGRYLVEVLEPWESRGRAVAIDSTTLQAKGGVWHKKDKEAGVVPHSSIDSEADPGRCGRQPDSSALDRGTAPGGRFVLGDTHYNAQNVRDKCERTERFLVASKRGAYPHTDAGVEVRRIFHKLRSLANENFNEHFKSIFEVHEQVPTKGRVNTARFALGAVLVYQLALLYRHERNSELNRGLKPFLRAA